MYADQVSVGTKRTLKDRLDGGGYSESRSNSDKRQRQTDSKWEHDLYDNYEERQSKKDPKLGAKDLRLHLRQKGSEKVNRNRKNSLGVRDLRDRLSGIMHSQLANSNLPKPKPRPIQEVAKPARRSVPVEVPQAEVKRAVNPTPSRKKSQHKSDQVDALLQSLDLEKYLISFQAEEIDMTALLQMSDDDLKALGIPMKHLFLIEYLASRAMEMTLYRWKGIIPKRRMEYITGIQFCMLKGYINGDDSADSITCTSSARLVLGIMSRGWYARHRNLRVTGKGGR
ncbi:hypothetical protein GIB67_034948 [Kingdonia uniflora]|uniref:SAM domain-containing protein n=1 Tax=Kingdonia uniflora TaxID=39325 RepID=A0A7J7NGW7_9MAGN|nr:hypothetical protein GIB67_034948 [Kingdonia uniflora]